MLRQRRDEAAGGHIGERGDGHGIASVEETPGAEGVGAVAGT